MSFNSCHLDFHFFFFVRRMCYFFLNNQILISFEQILNISKISKIKSKVVPQQQNQVQRPHNHKQHQQHNHQALSNSGEKMVSYF
jgi:hypothetical protein